MSTRLIYAVVFELRLNAPSTPEILKCEQIPSESGTNKIPPPLSFFLYFSVNFSTNA